MEIQQKDNETPAPYIHCFRTAAKQCVLIMTLQQSAFLLSDFEMHPSSQLKYMKRTLKLWLQSQVGWKTHRSTLSNSLNKIPPSGTPCHQDISHLRQWYTNTWRNRSHSTDYGPRHGRHFNRSQSHHYSHCNSSSSFRRHISHSSSNQQSSLCCPLADGCTLCHLCHDTSKWHSCTPSHTCHFSHKCNSCHYSMDWSWSHSSNSHHTAQEPQPRRAKPHPRPSTLHKPHHSKTVTMQNSPSHSSSDSDSDSDPLNY